MEKVTDFTLIEDDYDIDTTCGIYYRVDVKLTITDILEFAPNNLLEVLMGKTDVGIDSVSDDNYISFNKYGDGEYNFDYECCNEIKKRYMNKDNSPTQFTVELCDLTPALYDSLPIKIKEALPQTIEYTRPKFTFEKPKVEVITRLEKDKKELYQGSYKYLGFDVQHTDIYSWTNIERDIFKTYTPNHKKFYWNPLTQQFTGLYNDIETIQNLINDIAKNGIRTEVRYEVNGAAQLIDIIESGHRHLIAMFLGLPYIPGCYVYRMHNSIPFLGAKINNGFMNKQIVDELNKKFDPEVIFYYNDKEIIDGGFVDEPYEEAMIELKQKMIQSFPTTLVKVEDLSDRAQIVFRDGWK